MKITEIIPALINEMAAAGNFRNRIWYHGTSTRNFQKILATKTVRPSLADNAEFGSAIWLSSDPEEAKDFGNVVLAIPNEIARKFKLVRISPFPHGFIKKHQIPAKDVGHYHMVITQAVPLKYWKRYDPKTGRLIAIS